MSKTLIALVALVVLLGSYFVIRNAKNAYKALPIEEENPLNINNSNLQKWREFSNADGKFKVSMPALPQHVTDMIADPVSGEQRKFEMYASADENGVAYVISTITLPNKLDPKDVEKVLRNAVNEMLVRNKNNKLKAAKMVEYQGLDALEFEFENAEVSVLGKAVPKGSTIFILSVVGKPDVFNSESLDFFMNSFRIQKDRAKNKEM